MERNTRPRTLMILVWAASGLTACTSTEQRPLPVQDGATDGSTNDATIRDATVADVMLMRVDGGPDAADVDHVAEHAQLSLRWEFEVDGQARVVNIEVDSEFPERGQSQFPCGQLRLPLRAKVDAGMRTTLSFRVCEDEQYAPLVDPTLDFSLVVPSQQSTATLAVAPNDFTGLSGYFEGRAVYWRYTGVESIAQKLESWKAQGGLYTATGTVDMTMTRFYCQGELCEELENRVSASSRVVGTYTVSLRPRD